MQSNDENACQTNTYQVSHTGPNWRRMSLLVSQLQLFLKQLLAVMVDRLELDALGFTPSWTIHFYHPPTHLWALFV